MMKFHDFFAQSRIIWNVDSFMPIKQARIVYGPDDFLVRAAFARLLFDNNFALFVIPLSHLDNIK